MPPENIHTPIKDNCHVAKPPKGLIDGYPRPNIGFCRGQREDYAVESKRNERKNERERKRERERKGKEREILYGNQRRRSMRRPHCSEIILHGHTKSPPG